MKKVIFVAIVAAVSMISCKGMKDIKSFSLADSVAYAVGVDFGIWAKQLDSTLNVNMLAAAISDGMKGKTMMTREEAQAFLNNYYLVRVPAQKAEAAKAEQNEWFDLLKKENSNIQSTESGLLYEIVEAGDMATRATLDTDKVTVNYKGTLKDESVFDENQNISFPLNGVIRGWTEGLKLVGKGGKINLWIPAEMAYGTQERPGIPANSPLKFEVELLEVVPAEEAAQ